MGRQLGACRKANEQNIVFQRCNDDASPSGGQNLEQLRRALHALNQKILQLEQHTCSKCDRSFCDANALEQHMQVHQPRDVRCPACGEQRFRNGANVAQHVESGTCSGCQGKENARTAIYNFMRFNQSTRQFLDQKLLENGACCDSIPERPYACQQCRKAFRQVSQLMQHQMAVHPKASLPLLGL